MRKAIAGWLLPVSCAFAWPAGYAAHYTLTVNSGQITGTLTNFPALYSGTIPGLATVTNGGYVRHTCPQTVGSYSLTVPCDAVLTSDPAGSSLLTGWEWESYNSGTGAFAIWFQVGSIANGTVVHLWVGNPGVTTPQTTASNTWPTAYAMVQHLPDGSTLSAYDSTRNGVNGTLVNSPSAVAGEIEGAAGFNTASQQYINDGSPASTQITNNLTLQAWFKSSSTAEQILLMNQFRYATNAGAYLSLNDSTPTNVAGNYVGAFFGSGTSVASVVYATAAATDGAWHKLDAAFSSGTCTLYLDGSQVAQNASCPPAVSYGAAGTNFILTARNQAATTYSTMAVDELRIAGAALTSSWIAAEYRNESAPGTFWSLAGPFVSQPGCGQGQVLMME
jgi:hypothetical protein